jgi:hypothetical protein
MLASCEYLPQELFECYTESCEIYPADDGDVPSSIRASDFDEHDFELDGWARWDMPSEDYYDTLLFPEDYTGYDGSEIWRFIHDRIGFHTGDMVTDEYDADDWKADFNKVSVVPGYFYCRKDACVLFSKCLHACIYCRSEHHGGREGGTSGE